MMWVFALIAPKTSFFGPYSPLIEPRYSHTKIVLANCPRGIGRGYEILNKNRSNDKTRRDPMSLHPQPIPAIPEETARLARAVLPEGNVLMQMRDA